MQTLQKRNILFNESLHKYTCEETKKDYISVTTLISKFQKPFNLEEKSAKKALELGITQQEVKEMWNKKKNDAADRGTMFHKIFESYIKDGIIEKNFEKSVNSLIKLNIQGKLFSEKLVYYEPALIAGTADIIALDKPNYVDIWDFKTNEKITDDSYGQFFNSPLSHLKQSKLKIYELQLSTYAYICELWGMRPRNLTILWLDPETLELKPYTCNYLRNESQSIINRRISYLNYNGN